MANIGYKDHQGNIQELPFLTSVSDMNSAELGRRKIYLIALNLYLSRNMEDYMSGDKHTVPLAQSSFGLKQIDDIRETLEAAQSDIGEYLAQADDAVVRRCCLIANVPGSSALEFVKLEGDELEQAPIARSISIKRQDLNGLEEAHQELVAILEGYTTSTKPADALRACKVSFSGADSTLQQLDKINCALTRLGETLVPDAMRAELATIKAAVATLSADYNRKIQAAGFVSSSTNKTSSLMRFYRTHKMNHRQKNSKILDALNGVNQEVAKAESALERAVKLIDSSVRTTSLVAVI